MTAAQRAHGDVPDFIEAMQPNTKTRVVVQAVYSGSDIHGVESWSWHTWAERKIQRGHRKGDWRRFGMFSMHSDRHKAMHAAIVSKRLLGEDIKIWCFKASDYREHASANIGTGF